MIKYVEFGSQKELLKWLRKGGVRWTAKQLKENFTKTNNFSTDAYGGHISIVRTGQRKYLANNS